MGYVRPRLGGAVHIWCVGYNNYFILVKWHLRKNGKQRSIQALRT